MEAVRKIDLPDWLNNRQTQKIMKLISGDVTSPQSLLVGGCVRNAVMGAGQTDIDIATKLTPQAVIEIFDKEQIKNIPTGIEHGTITAVIDSQAFEITTLRHDVETDGRRAKVAFTDDWVADASRRDFTMNALFADSDGNIYDPLGQGISDLEKRYVRFVGKPAARIEEDYLRILRFFRFHAQYGEGEPDGEALKACTAAAGKISTLSRERITNEFLKILDADKAPEVLVLMSDNDVLKDIYSKDFNSEALSDLIKYQDKYDAQNAISRYFVFSGSKARFHDDYLRLSHAQKNFLIKLEMVVGGNCYANEKSLKKAIYHHGNDLLLQGYLVAIALEEARENQELLNIIKNWHAPKFPITGEDLIAEGYKTGPELGQELERREEEWLETVI